MLVIKRPYGRTNRFAVLFKPGEFAPCFADQNRDQLFEDFSRWGVSLTSLANALGVADDRVRGWKARRKYRIPQLYWLQLVHVHKSIFQHLLENEYVDLQGNILPNWSNLRKRNVTKKGQK